MVRVQEVRDKAGHAEGKRQATLGVREVVPRVSVAVDMAVAQTRLEAVHSVRGVGGHRELRGVVSLPDGFHRMGDGEEQMVVLDRLGLLDILGGARDAFPRDMLGVDDSD